MMRTLRSHFKRWLLWKWADGKCQRCSNPIQLSEMHADHKTPWRMTHRTNIHEMQALCAACNLTKGGTAMYDLGGLRLGQRRALDTIIERLKNGHTHTAIVMATRYGKSDLQRAATMIAVDRGLACCSLSLSPNKFLRDQLVDDKKWEAFSKRLQITNELKYAPVDTCVEQPTANGETFLSSTIQFFQRNLGYWIDFGKACYLRTGKPVLLLVDECQYQSTANEWGYAVTEWQKDTHGHVTLMTATANRSDGECIPGFVYHVHSSAPVQVYKTRPGSTKEKVLIEVYDANEKTLELEAHSTTDFAAAWRENVLCHVEHLPFEIDLSKVSALGSKTGMLSEIENRKDIRRALSVSVRDQKVIEFATRLAIERHAYFRAGEQTCAGIIFCGNDSSDGETNKHAKQIERALLMHDRSLRVVIATSADDSAGSEAIQHFAKGDGDFLIVKQMASVGLDISRLKVGLDLSPIRAAGAVTQRMMRIATPHCDGRMLACCWITPNDLLSQAIFESVVRQNGGQATVTDLQFVKSYEKDRNIGPDPDQFSILGARGVGAIDSKENRADQHEIDQIKKFLAVVPEAAAFVTLPELAQRWQASQATETATPPQNTKVDIERMRNAITERASQCIKHRRRGQPYSQNGWAASAQDIWKEAYNSVGVKAGVELKQINDLALLARLLAAFEGMPA